MVLIIPGCFSVAIKGTSGGQDVVNVIGIRSPGNTPLSVATAVLSAWKTAGGPLSKLPSLYTLQEIRAMDLSSASGGVFSLPDNTAGGTSGPLSTNGSCALVTYGAGTRAKSERGRMYFGPLTENGVAVDGRSIVGATAFTAAFTAFRTAVNGANMEWVILSRKNSTATAISSITTQAIIATQRRRIR